MHGEMCQKTPKRKHVLMCLQSYNEGSGPIRCVGLILAGCKSHASKWSPLVGLRLPAPAFIVRPLPKPSTLGKPSHKKTSNVQKHNIITDPFTSPRLLIGASSKSHFQIHLGRKRRTKPSDITGKSCVKGPIARAIVCLLVPLAPLYWHVTSPDSCLHLQPDHVAES